MHTINETPILCSENFNGHRYLVLWRNTSQSKTDMCPFCYNRHLHTPEDGHRASHCNLFTNKAIRLSDGSTVYAFDGYIVRTRQHPKNTRPRKGRDPRTH